MLTREDIDKKSGLTAGYSGPSAARLAAELER